MKTALTQSLVLELVAEYNSKELTTLESYLFEKLSPKIAEQGFINQEQFLKICEWKTTRTKTLTRQNLEEDIIEISTQAFSCSNHLRVKFLTLLQGVAVPTASAILSVWSPSSFTVYDFRVLSAIGKLEHKLLTFTPHEAEKINYLPYLNLAKAISDDLGVSLRDLDKCFWIFDKYFSN